MSEAVTIRLLVGRGKPVWISMSHDGMPPLTLIHRNLASEGLAMTEEEVKLYARIEMAAPEEAIALARSHNDQKLAEWPSMARFDPLRSPSKH